MSFLLFWEISKMALFGQNWPKFDLNLAISGYMRPEAWVFKKKMASKILKFFYFFFYFFIFSKSKKNYFGRKKSTFCPDEHHYDSPLSTLRKNVKFLKWKFLHTFFQNKSKFLFFFRFFSWNMVSIVEVEIFGFLPFSNWPDFDQKWSKNRSFWASNGSK